MKQYVLSPFLRFILSENKDFALAYNTLFGNARILCKDALNFLDIFRTPKNIREVEAYCDSSPQKLISNFVDLNFLIDSVKDERKQLELIKEDYLRKVENGSTIDRLGLAISDKCNLKCDHCIHFQTSVDSGSPAVQYSRRVSQTKMTWPIAKYCIDRYINLMRLNGRKILKVHFGNAEPLLNWFVIDKCLSYITKYRDFSYDFVINTNLTLITKEIAEKLKEYNVRIATSLDGLEDANDLVRRKSNGSGTFKMIVDKFELLDQINYPLDGFSITVVEKNFEKIDFRIIDFAKDRQMSSIAFDYDLTNMMSIPVRDKIDKLLELKKYASNENIDFFGTWDSIYRNLMSPSFLVDHYSFCAAVEGKSLECMVDGKTGICSHATILTGDIENFDTVFQQGGALYKLVSERFPGADENCYGCDFEGLCSGQCHVTREAFRHRFTGSDLYSNFNSMCNFYRLITKALIKDDLKSGNYVV